MQINEKRTTEIFLSLILVVLLIILILLVLNYNSKSINNENLQKQNTQIINSYNTYYISEQDSSRQILVYKTKKPNLKYSRYSQKPILVYDSSRNYKDKYLSYTSTGKRKQVEGLFGNKIDKYIVRIRNPNPKGGYYKIIFHFEDYYGRERTESVTKYLKPYEEKEIYYTDVTHEEYKNSYWDYEVVPLTKIE